MVPTANSAKVLPFVSRMAMQNSISATNSAATNHEAFPDNTLISMSAMLKLSPCANDLGSDMAIVNIR